MMDVPSLKLTRMYNKPMENNRLLFIHGSESNSQTYKAQVLRGLYPEILVPDFTGPLSVRMAQLEEILQEASGWTLIGSSLGGLMAVYYASRHPEQVRKLILLAPALHVAEFSKHLPKPIRVPAVLIIGKKDDVIPGDLVHRIARRILPGLSFISVDDDHRLHHTADHLDWEALLS